MSAAALLEQRRPRNLAQGLVASLAGRIRDGRLAPGDKLATEAELMREFGVSRSVVREALASLQASVLVETRHGIGTFVSTASDVAVFSIRPEQVATLNDVVAMLELRIGVETEAAGLAAKRRTATNLDVMKEALVAFTQAIEAGQDAVGADFRFHLEIARATQNSHFESLMQTLGTAVIPRARLDPAAASARQRQAYLRRLDGEHGSILAAIESRDAEAAWATMRTHLVNSRERRRQAGRLVAPLAASPARLVGA